MNRQSSLTADYGEEEDVQIGTDENQNQILNQINYENMSSPQYMPRNNFLEDEEEEKVPENVKIVNNEMQT